jgi:hypothetical protein
MGLRRAYTADQILQIVDQLAIGGELSQAEAAAMTKLGLTLKLVESAPDAELSASLCTTLAHVKEFQETALPKELAQ